MKIIQKSIVFEKEGMNPVPKKIEQLFEDIARAEKIAGLSQKRIYLEGLKTIADDDLKSRIDRYIIGELAM